MPAERQDVTDSVTRCRSTGHGRRRPRVVPAGVAPARALCIAVGGLLLAALVMAQFGWSSSVVVGGSMRPAVQPGDVVITAPMSPGQVRPGHVVRFRPPDGRGRQILHRVAGFTPDGLLVTKGDANTRQDAVPVPTGSVTGTGRLRVPYAGLPVLWFVEGRHPHVLATVLVVVALGAAVWLRSRRSGRRPS